MPVDGTINVIMVQERVLVSGNNSITVHSGGLQTWYFIKRTRAPLLRCTRISVTSYTLVYWFTLQRVSGRGSPDVSYSCKITTNPEVT